MMIDNGPHGVAATVQARTTGHRRKHWHLGMMILAAPILISASRASEHQTPEPKTLEDVVKTFGAQVFMAINNDEKFLVKWNDPIKVGIANDGSVSLDILSKLSRDLVDIEKITDTKISIADENINFFILISQTQGNLFLSTAIKSPRFLLEGLTIVNFFSNMKKIIRYARVKCCCLTSVIFQGISYLFLYPPIETNGPSQNA